MAKPLALIAALAALVVPTCALAEPPVWTIHDRDATIVLFGSVHILPNVNWQPKALDEALAKADDLWFEIPLDDAAQQAASQGIAQKGMLPEGQSLLALLGPKDQARLTRVCAKLGLPVATVDRLQPWLADATLSDVLLSTQGAVPNQGVEQILQHQVPATVPRHAFETADQQIAMLSGASRAAQLASLKDTLRSIEDDPNAFNRLVGLWMKGDAKGLDREAVEDLRHVSPELYDVMLKRRNTAWVDQILARLKGSGETVMVVGVGHLVGPDSVPAMLRARGIKVEGP
jgi:uncharacterized protein YbaP (TraB family)